ncbi:MAG: SixA phosphatase family protein [Pyrinomonadaceae bacterium]
MSEKRLWTNHWLLYAVIVALVISLLTFLYYRRDRPLTTVILVRHAEKNIEPSNPNPNLSPAGHARAQELVRVLSGSGVTAIYATQYVRTQQTVQPLATAMGLPVTQIDSGNTNELVRQVTTLHRGGIVFLAGHNNSVPAIIGALGGGNYPIIPDSDYDNMFVVTIDRLGKAKTIPLKYGSAMPATGNQQMIVKP